MLPNHQINRMGTFYDDFRIQHMDIEPAKLRGAKKIVIISSIRTVEYKSIYEQNIKNIML